MPQSLAIVILGATGAVGSEVLKELLVIPNIGTITLLGRRIIPSVDRSNVVQRTIDIHDPTTYVEYVKGHDVAICTLGVGEPSRISKEEFVRIDKTAVIQFAQACKLNGVRHFELLASVGISAASSSFYLRTKGELVEELKALNFERLSIFQPSMILTPSNRYGIMQGITLFVWPLISTLFFGPLRKFKGVKIESLGRAMARNVLSGKKGLEYLTWGEFEELTKT